MKRKMTFVFAMALIFLTITGVSTADTEEIQETDVLPVFQSFDLVKGTVTATFLNVRQGPSTKYNIIRVLKNGQEVKIFGKIGDWYAVYESPTGCVGAVYSKYISIGGEEQQPVSGPKTETGHESSLQPATPPENVSRNEQQLLDLINKARIDAGLTALEFDSDLMDVVRLKAKDMVDNNYFSHQSPTYGSPFDMMRQFSINFKTAGENIAGNKTVEAAFNAWMNSENHKRNILNAKFNCTGIGIVKSNTYGLVLVQQFIGK